MSLRTRPAQPSSPPEAPRQMPPLGWIVVAGLLVILVFAYSSWRGDWSAPFVTAGAAAAGGADSGQG